MRISDWCSDVCSSDLDALIAQGLFTYRSGLDAAEILLARDPPPTAIFASNDDMAAAAVAVAHHRGVDVPGDLSICGFDDTPFATTIWPALTTIHQQIGRAHVCTPVTNEHPVCRLLLEKKKNTPQ